MLTVLFLVSVNSVFAQLEFVHLTGDNTVANTGSSVTTMVWENVSQYTTGKINQSFDFKNGDFLNSTDFNPDTSGFDIDSNWSMSLWVNIDTFASDDQIIQFKSVSSTSFDFRTQTGANLIEARWNNGGTTFVFSNANQVNNWYWLTVIHNESESKFYFFLNNTFVGSQTDVTYTVQNDTLVVGGGRAGIFLLDGAVDDVRLYNFSLTEVQRNFIWNDDSGTQNVLFESIVLSEPTPSSGFVSNATNVNFSVIGNFSTSANCSLLINGSVNQTFEIVSPVNNSQVNFSQSFLDGSYSYSINCVDNLSSVSTFTNLFFVEVMSLGSSLPIDNSSFNVSNINFNVSGNFSNTATCSLLINDTLNQSNNFQGFGVFVDFNVTFTNGFYDYKFSCNDTFGNVENTTTKTFLIDVTLPVITTNFLNESLWFDKNLTGQFNFTDDIFVHSVNITIDGLSVFLNESINLNFFQLNFSRSVSNLSIGKHELTVRVADGHTAKKLLKSSSYNPSTGLFKNYVKYDFEKPYKSLFIETYVEGRSLGDSWSVIEKEDKYSEVLKPKVPGSEIVLIVESDELIEIVIDEGGRYGGSWLIIGDHWKDFVLEGESYSKVVITRLTDKSVKVVVSGIYNNPRTLTFNSVGDLNVVTAVYDFYVVNMTTSSDIFLVEGFNAVFNLSVDFGLLEFNISALNPTSFLVWDNSDFSTTNVLFNESEATFTRAIFIPLTSGLTSVNHNWSFNLTGHTVQPLISGTSSQLVSNILVAPCRNDLTNFTIINMSYFDEIDDSVINLTNSFNLEVFDGTYFYNQSGSFSNNVSDSFCSNLDPLNISYNWAVWGTFTLSKPGFVSRVVNFPQTTNFTVSNDPHLNISLFLVGIANSTTISYSWLTTEFQPVDGVMRVLRCNDDGSQTLVESNTIISGSTTANLQLLTTPYTYEVVIGDSVFTEPDTWSQCHVESVTELSFLVDIGAVSVAEIIGLSGVPCSLTVVSNDSVKLSWSSNSFDSSLLVGCVKATNTLVTGGVVRLDNCTDSAGVFFNLQNLTAFIGGGNDLNVVGRLEQGNASVACLDTVVFRISSPAQSLWLLSALFGVFLIVSMLTLVYSRDSEMMLYGSIIGFVATWVIGLLNFGWLTVSSIIAFLVLIAFIGRSSRSK